jgi:heme/copper-type cytochrome/quinol oxidase subunit 2
MFAMIDNFELLSSTIDKICFYDISSFDNIDHYINLSSTDIFSKTLIDLVPIIENTFNNISPSSSTATLHYSIPTVKLAYPEPFIASASLMHSDLWFIHILIYQYWLWFVFIFLIIFFLITFIGVVRWCNIRIRPRRETRGVSRSKCGDLITACVPVSWAASIIVHESTDAIDFFDGFGTSELIIGIRAYQWGWEYYYPKEMDLNHSFRQNFSSFIGNSLKYESSSSKNFQSQNLWKFYQTKKQDATLNSLTTLLTHDMSHLLNLSSFNQIGLTQIGEGEAFPIIRQFNKFSLPSTLVSSSSLSTTPTRIHEIYFSLNFFAPHSTNLITLVDFKVSQYTFFNFSISQSNTLISIFENKLTFLDEFNKLFNHLKNNNSSAISQFTPFDETAKISNNEKVIRKFFPKKTSLFSIFDSLTILNHPSIILSNFNIALSVYNLKNLNNNTYFDLSASPLITNQPLYNLFNFDKSFTFEGISATALQAKDELIIPSLLTAYWNTSHLTQTIHQKLIPLISYQNSKIQNFLPPFSPIYDYEFRNWQSFELLEEILWDDLISINVIDENLDNILTFDESQHIHKLEKPYWQLSRLFLPSAYRSLKNAESFSYWPSKLPSPITTSDNLELSTFDYKSIFALTTLHSRTILNNFEQVVDMLLFRRFFISTQGLNLKLNYFNFYSITPLSSVLNAFRSDYEGEISELADYSFTFGYDTFIPYSSLNLKSIVCTLSPLTTTNWITIVDSIPLRQATKDIIVTSNAINKVFKNRYDEGRSHARLADFDILNETLPLVVGARPLFEKYLHKQSTTAITTTFYVPNFINKISPFLTLAKFQNLPPFDFPFLTALKSESARYIWLDWYSHWDYVDVQPSSSSRYAIMGVPHFNRTFNFSPSMGETFSETETYFARLARARKNYLPAWTFSPLINNKISLVNSSQSWFELIYQTAELTFVQLEIFRIVDSWTSPVSSNFHLSSLVSSFSGNELYAKTAALAKNEENKNYIFLTQLNDILTKREFFYRLLNSNFSTILDINHVSSQDEIRNALLNLFSQTSELSNAIHINKYANDFISNAVLTDYNYKNQYRPMRKGINNLLRLHATGAIAIPTEVRLQILASSKDVIHSWAIPSAGIKIDCVPGYSSHRIMIFLISGIFWGQCMEICGRYHHWMPIVVYFMRRDLFWLWCSHFVFFKTSEGKNVALAGAYRSHLNLVSFEKRGWLEEIK